MCEFNVIVDGKVQLRDVIYSKVDGETVTVKNIMGEAKIRPTAARILSIRLFATIPKLIPTISWASIICSEPAMNISSYPGKL